MSGMCISLMPDSEATLPRKASCSLGMEMSILPPLISLMTESFSVSLRSEGSKSFPCGTAM